MTQPPPPQGLYVAAKRHGDLIFVSGMTPRRDGELLYSGKVDGETELAGLKAPVTLAMENALAAARGQLGPTEVLCGALSLTVYVNAAPTYTEHSKVADFASSYLADQFGGVVPSRAAIGVTSLPGNAPVEIGAIFSVQQHG